MSQNLNGNQNFRNLGQRRQINNARGPQNNPGQKIRLRRSGNNKQAVIQKNLGHMQMQAQKKRMAQEFYYSAKGGQSPMTRLAVSPLDSSENKSPVHNRLGNKTRLRRPVDMPNTTRPQVRNTIRLQRRPQQMQRFPMNNDKIIRIYSAQNRLTRIRQGGGNMMQRGSMQRVGLQRNNMQRGVVQRGFVQRGNFQQGLNNAGQKIRLHRNRPQPVGGAVNYTVQVANNNTGLRARNSVKHHVSAELNPNLQEEIRIIQNKNIPQNIIEPEPIHPSGTGFTSRSLHERFSEL